MWTRAVIAFDDGAHVNVKIPGLLGKSRACILPVSGGLQAEVGMREFRTIALMLASAAALAACEDRGAGAGDTGLALDAAAGPAGATALRPGGPGAVLSDANIFYILDAVNRVDSAAGSIAATKGTNSAIREYGAMMARDHHQLRRDGQALATRLGIAPSPPPGDTAQAHFDKTTATLNGISRGRDFDKAYIDHEVAYHRNVLETATSAMSLAENAELRNMIQKAAPAILAHLDRAQAIQGQLQ